MDEADKEIDELNDVKDPTDGLQIEKQAEKMLTKIKGKTMHQR